MNTSPLDPVPSDPRYETSAHPCPQCGYCPHCGRSNQTTPVSAPLPYFWPYTWPQVTNVPPVVTYTYTSSHQTFL